MLDISRFAGDNIGLKDKVYSYTRYRDFPGSQASQGKTYNFTKKCVAGFALMQNNGSTANYGVFGSLANENEFAVYGSVGNTNSYSLKYFDLTDYSLYIYANTWGSNNWVEHVVFHEE